MASLPKVVAGSPALVFSNENDLFYGQRRCVRPILTGAQLLRIKMTDAGLFASPRPFKFIFRPDFCERQGGRSAFAGADLADDHADDEEDDRAAEHDQQVGHALALALRAGERADELRAIAHDDV